jgi:hypothetical protein
LKFTDIGFTTGIFGISVHRTAQMKSQYSYYNTQNDDLPTLDKYLSCSTLEERIASVLPPLAATPVRIIEATELRSIADDRSKTALFIRFFHVATGNRI